MKNFAKNKKAIIFPWTCVETSNLQVKFFSRAAFHNWYFQQYHHFILRLIRVIYKKFWSNKIPCLTIQLPDKWPVILEFFRSKKAFFWVIKIGIWTFPFYKKNNHEKENLFKISKSLYFLLGACTNIIFGLFRDIYVYFIKNVVSLLWSI